MRSENSNRGAAAFLGGMGAGAALMYVLDPDRGGRRRAQLRDQATHLISRERDLVDKGMRDLGQRTGGFFAELRGSFRDGEVPDEIMVERVRAQLGRAVSHPHAIEVEAQQGRVILHGAIFASEVSGLLKRVRRVRGVREVVDQLERHQSAEGVSALQGGGALPPRSILERQSWPPGLRLLGMSTGVISAAYGLTRGGLIGSGLSLFGGALLLRSLTGRPARELLGLGYAVKIDKSLVVEAPIDDVFGFWSHLENFPRFMEHVREVVSIGESRTRWTVMGPARTELSYETETTVFEPGRSIGWRTLPDQPIEHSGLVRFEKIDDQRTRIQVRMSYSPPAGVVGHAVARLFRADPKTAMDEDLIRMKSLLENGKTRADGHAVHVEELR